MGMFDYVDVGEAVPCPFCDAPITHDWQSKSRQCLMNTIPWQDTDSFYTHCQKCNAWVHYVRDEPEPPRRFEGLTLQPERQFGTPLVVTSEETDDDN